MSQELVTATAEDLAQASIDAQPLSMRSYVRDSDGRLLERRAKPLFALLKCQLHDLLRRDVAEIDAQTASPGRMHSTSDPVLTIRALALEARHNAVGSSPLVWALDGQRHLTRQDTPYDPAEYLL